MKRATITFWLTIALGFTVSPIAAVAAGVAKGSSLAAAVSQWIGRLFEPGYNEFLLVLIAAAPFLVAAVFFLFHLAAEQVPRGRWAGIAGAVLAGVVMSLEGLIATRMSRSSTAGIGYIFLPYLVLFAMIIGYVAGRLIAKVGSAARG